MSASIVFGRQLSKIISSSVFRKAVTASRLVHVSTRSTASLPLVSSRRGLSGVRGPNGEKPSTSTESNSSESQPDVNPREEKEWKEEEAEYEHSVRQKILTASLDHVLRLGWTKQALEAGAQSEGLPPIAHGMFERSGAEIVDHFYKKCNAELAEHLKKESERVKADGEEQLKTHAFLQKAIETRLRMVLPYHRIWKEAMALQALPENAPDAVKNVMKLADDIWYYAGDRSTDFDWYTKRGSLAAVYKATEVYMLQDRSADYADTWSFLEKRLTDLDKLADVKNSLEPLMGTVNGLLTMARNILGVNSRNR